MNELKEALDEFMSSYYVEITHSQYELICNHINNLQSKIDKAIEFCDYSFKNPWYVSEKELLGKIIDILKEDK